MVSGDFNPILWRCGESDWLTTGSRADNTLHCHDNTFCTSVRYNFCPKLGNQQFLSPPAPEETRPLLTAFLLSMLLVSPSSPPHRTAFHNHIKSTYLSIPGFLFLIPSFHFHYFFRFEFRKESQKSTFLWHLHRNQSPSLLFFSSGTYIAPVTPSSSAINLKS